MIRSDFRGRRRAERRLRVGLWFLCLTALVPGVWAYFAPRSFFDDFPGAGLAWVSMHPPFNEHLVRDVGGFFMAFALLLGLAAVWKRRVLTVAALWSWLVFAVAHFLFHVRHLEGQTWEKVAQVAVFAVAIGVPLLLLPAVRRSERSSF